MESDPLDHPIHFRTHSLAACPKDRSSNRAGPQSTRFLERTRSHRYKRLYVLFHTLLDPAMGTRVDVILHHDLSRPHDATDTLDRLQLADP